MGSGRLVLAESRLTNTITVLGRNIFDRPRTQYVMDSSKKQFLTHAFIYGFGGLLNQFAPLILFPLYTNYLPPGDYAILDIIDRSAWLINIIFVVSGIRLATLTFYKQAKSEEEKRKVAVTLSFFLWGMVATAILSTFFLAVPLDTFFKTDDPALLIFGLSTALVGSLVTIPMALMQARMESLRFVLTNATMLTFRVGLCLFFLVWLELGIWGVLLSQCVVFVTSAVVLMIREIAIGSICPDFSKIKEVWTFCWPFIPAGLMDFFYGNADRYFILRFSTYPTDDATLEALGFYALAFRLQTFITLFGVSALRQVWSAKMYEIFKQPDAARVFGDFALKINIVFSLGALALCVFAKDLITAICHASYIEAAPLVIPLTVSAWFINFSYQLEQTYYITRTTRYKPWVIAFMLPVMFVFMFFLVPRWNVLGVAYALMCSSIVAFLINLAITQRVFRVDYHYFKTVLLFFVTASCFALSGLCGDGVVQNSLTPEQMAEMSKWDRIAEMTERVCFLPLLGKSLILFLWAGGMWGLGFLTPDDKSVLRDAVHGGWQRVRKIPSRFSKRK